MAACDLTTPAGILCRVGREKAGTGLPGKTSQISGQDSPILQKNILTLFWAVLQSNRGPKGRVPAPEGSAGLPGRILQRHNLINPAGSGCICNLPASHSPTYSLQFGSSASLLWRLAPG